MPVFYGKIFNHESDQSDGEKNMSISTGLVAIEISQESIQL